MSLSSQSGGHDDGALRLRPGDMLAFDHFRGEVRVIPTQDFAVQAAMTLPHAQKAARDFSAEAQTYQAALCELHRAVTEHDGGDADEARLQDAIREAQRLAPYEPEEPDSDGF